MPLTINGHPQQVGVDPEAPLLSALRDTLGLTGTRYGCGIASAVPARSTSMVSQPARAHCRSAPSKARPFGERRAAPGARSWIAHDVPQCGYCQSGMIMAVAALLGEKPQPSDADIDAAITNICRCGTYARIRATIHTAATASG
jgi:isoquinoline 1-oxidoreductase alpha subunit